MTQDIKEQLATLAALQKAEIEMARIERALSGVEAQVDALGSQIDGHEEKLATEKEKVAGLRAQYREDEAENKTIEDRINKDNDKLRAVKTNKEYQSMLKEIDGHTRNGRLIGLGRIGDLKTPCSALALAAELKTGFDV
ncbi:MAG: hypothetical protein P8X55_17260, partial [Desulfosarcinaceae bacterium]